MFPQASSFQLKSVLGMCHQHSAEKNLKMSNTRPGSSSRTHIRNWTWETDSDEELSPVQSLSN